MCYGCKISARCSCTHTHPPFVVNVHICSYKYGTVFEILYDSYRSYRVLLHEKKPALKKICYGSWRREWDSPDPAPSLQNTFMSTHPSTRGTSSFLYFEVLFILVLVSFTITTTAHNARYTWVLIVHLHVCTYFIICVVYLPACCFILEIPVYVYEVLETTNACTGRTAFVWIHRKEYSSKRMREPFLFLFLIRHPLVLRFERKNIVFTHGQHVLSKICEKSFIFGEFIREWPWTTDLKLSFVLRDLSELLATRVVVGSFPASFWYSQIHSII